jgi:hypothetical protein
MAALMAVSSPTPKNPVRITSSLAGAVDVLQDVNAFDPRHPIARGIAYKNRVFGQSHWMNGFVVFNDLVKMLEPHMKSNESTLRASMHRAKILGRTIKNSRAPSWPTVPTNDLPPKEVCDKLVEHYFRTIETLYRILHIPTFRREYEAMWACGSAPNTAFMILVKLVLAIGAMFFDENCSMRSEAIHWVCEAQTWISCPTFKSKLGLQHLQISVLLLIAREFTDVGSEFVWISAGSLLREAIYTGLHKDPSRLPRMNTFDSEMRRRIWNTILEINLQYSLISGGPCLISLEDFNTEPPRNFDDEQLESSDAHPQPDNIFTQMSFAIALQRTFPARLAVVKFLNDASTTGTYEETLRIDTMLRASYRTLRRTLQAYAATDTASAFATDAIDFIMHRYISSLHIPYFYPALHEATYAFSRKAVLDTSLKIWNLAFSASAADETDLTLLCRTGAGFFRGFTFHASSFLLVELRAQFQEEDSVPRPDLLSIPEHAADRILRCLEAGETDFKGYMMLRILTAHMDAIKQHVTDEETQAVVARAAEDAAEQCLPVLERIAGQTQNNGVEDKAGEFDFNFSPESMGDWDLTMPDLFDFNGGAFAEGNNFEAFLS